MVKQLRMRRFYSDYFYWFTMQQYLYKLKQSFIVLKKATLLVSTCRSHKRYINLLENTVNVTVKSERFFNSRKKSEYTVKTACVAQQQNMYVHIQKCGWLTDGHRGFTRRSRPSVAWKGWCWMTHRWARGLGEHSVCKTVVDLQLPEKPGEDKKKSLRAGASQYFWMTAQSPVWCFL